MEYMELVFIDVKIENIEFLLSKMMIIDKDNLIDSHFYFNEEDITYFSELDFNEYYSVPSTCMIKSKYAEIGIRVEDVVTIISGVSPMVEIVVNFKKISSNSMSNIFKFMESNKMIARHINFGIEPLETDDEIIYFINDSL